MRTCAPYLGFTQGGNQCAKLAWAPQSPQSPSSDAKLLPTTKVGLQNYCPPCLSKVGTLLPTAKVGLHIWVCIDYQKARLYQPNPITNHTTSLTSQPNEGLYPASNDIVAILNKPWHYRSNKTTATPNITYTTTKPNPNHTKPHQPNYNITHWARPN